MDSSFVHIYSMAAPLSIHHPYRRRILFPCAKSRNLETVEQVHKYIDETGMEDETGMGFQTVLTAALMDVYCKCGCYPLARDLFDEIPEKNLFCWNIVIRRE